MYFDAQEIKNIINPHVCKMIRCLIEEGNAAQVESIMLSAIQEVRKEEAEKRFQRPCNVDFSTDLLTECRDQSGRRRYKLAAIDDDPVMVPCAEGFWTPAND